GGPEGTHQPGGGLGGGGRPGGRRRRPLGRPGDGVIDVGAAAGGRSPVVPVRHGGRQDDDRVVPAGRAGAGPGERAAPEVVGGDPGERAARKRDDRRAGECGARKRDDRGAGGRAAWSPGGSGPGGRAACGRERPAGAVGTGSGPRVGPGAGGRGGPGAGGLARQVHGALGPAGAAPPRAAPSAGLNVRRSAAIGATHTELTRKTQVILVVDWSDRRRVKERGDG